MVTLVPGFIRSTIRLAQRTSGKRICYHIVAGIAVRGAAGDVARGGAAADVARGRTANRVAVDVRARGHASRGKSWWGPWWRHRGVVSTPGGWLDRRGTLALHGPAILRGSWASERVPSEFGRIGESRAAAPAWGCEARLELDAAGSVFFFFFF